MEELDLLCNLEKHHNSLDIYNNKLKKLKENISVNKMGNKILETEKKLRDMVQKKEKATLELRKSEQKLKEYNYKVKEIENKLYDGNIGDIKQLEKLSIEKDILKNTINDMEFEILDFMEYIEGIEKHSKKLENFLKKIREKKKKKLIEYKNLEDALNKNIEIEIKSINDIEKNMDEKLLNKYKLIRKNKKTAVAKVENNICSGCNTEISTYILEQIFKNEEIIYCELCGRILCN